LGNTVLEVDTVRDATSNALLGWNTKEKYGRNLELNIRRVGKNEYRFGRGNENVFFDYQPDARGLRAALRDYVESDDNGDDLRIAKIPPQFARVLDGTVTVRVKRCN
jgi:hypothetical protein